MTISAVLFVLIWKTHFLKFPLSAVLLVSLLKACFSEFYIIGRLSLPVAVGMLLTNRLDWLSRFKGPDPWHLTRLKAVSFVCSRRHAFSSKSDTFGRLVGLALKGMYFRIWYFWLSRFLAQTGLFSKADTFGCLVCVVSVEDVSQIFTLLAVLIVSLKHGCSKNIDTFAVLFVSL